MNFLDLTFKNGQVDAKSSALPQLKGKLNFEYHKNELFISIEKSLGTPLKISIDQPQTSLKIKAQSNAKAFIVHSVEHSLPEQSFVVDLDLDKNSYLSFSTRVCNQKNIQSEQKANLQGGAYLDLFTQVTSTDLFAQKAHVFLNSSAGTALVDAAYSAEQKQKYKLKSLIEHKAPGCVSKQLYKGIVNDSAKTEFDGKIIIHENCPKAYSEQLNKNLILSRTAEAKSIPQLEIYTDDVQATHGSTTGQLSSEEIFYFQSRAISKEKAIELISAGFLFDVLDRVEDETVKQWFKKNKR